MNLKLKNRPFLYVPPKIQICYRSYIGVINAPRPIRYITYPKVDGTAYLFSNRVRSSTMHRLLQQLVVSMKRILLSIVLVFDEKLVL